jgi:hypothetical protein
MKGYRTLIFNGIMALVAILSQFGAFGDTAAPMAEAVNQGLDVVDSIIVAVTVIGNAGLRIVTTTAVGKSA